MPNIMRLGGGGGVGLNIAYGLTPPTDTSKLWVPLAQKPANVEISGDSLQSAVDVIGNKVTALPSSIHSAATVEIGGKVYIFGGMHTASGSYQDTIYEYDPATDTIVTKDATLASAMANMCAVAIKGKAYIIGGQTGSSTASSNIYEYDPVTDTITKMGESFGGVIYNAAAVAINDKAYIFGGNTSATQSTSGSKKIKEYDPATDTIVTKNSELATNIYNACAAVINGKAYIFGGLGANTTYQDTIQEYDPIADICTTKNTPLLFPVAEASACTINNKAYIFGGVDKTTTANTEIQEYDPATETVIIKNATIETGYRDTSAVAVGNEAYIFGGRDSSVSTLIRCYTPKAYLAENHLKVFGSVYRSAEHQVITNIVNGKKEQIKLYMTSAFIGDAEGYAMAQDAYVYDDVNSEWQALDGTSMTTDMLAALAELGVT